MMNLRDRLAVLVALGQRLQKTDEYREAIMKRTHFNNQWFTVENQEHMFRAIAQNFLDEQLLTEWTRTYHLSDPVSPKTGWLGHGRKHSSRRFS